MTKTSFDPSQVHLYRPSPSSHKGQNGKLLVIGGSELFHSSIFWSADVASKIVDLVHFTSPANENNEVVRKRIKEGFWSGIVVDWRDVEKYIEEDDCVLIGPGMIRHESKDSDIIFSRVARQSQDISSVQESHSSLSDRPLKNLEIRSGMGSTDDQFPRKKISSSLLHEWAEKDKTKEVVDYLLKKFPKKRWVIDGGALQEVKPELLNENCIITPHKKEFEGLLKRSDLGVRQGRTFLEACANLSHQLGNCTILLKGQTDTVCQGKRCAEIKGGNAGMTKGGTGDVLAGLVAALFCKNSAWTAAMVGSYVNKKAGDELYKRVGPYFNAADLLLEIPKILALLQRRYVQ